jgi:hypothetical protein
MKLSVFATCLLVLTMASSGQSHRLRGSIDDESQRHLAGQEYYRTNDTAVLGVPDVNAAIGNPLKVRKKWSLQFFEMLPHSLTPIILFLLIRVLPAELYGLPHPYQIPFLWPLSSTT